MRPYVVVPTYVASPESLEVTSRCLSSLAASNPGSGDAEVIVVDDASPHDVGKIAALAHSKGWDFQRNERNSGFAKTVNVGLRRARDDGRDAILVNADVGFMERSWQMAWRREDRAEVEGALLFFPTQPLMVQHAGIFFSVLRREFDHIHRFAPAALPDLAEPRVCPVTAALMQIRHDVLEDVGLFDEDFRMGWEDVDYCIRVFAAGGKCLYNPEVRALHHESVFRSTSQSAKLARWTAKSWDHLWAKHAGTDFSRWIPTMLGVE